MKISTPSLVLMLLVAGSTSNAAAGSPGHGAPTVVTSICTINRDPAAYAGQVVTVSGVYKADSMVFEYIEDPSCKKLNILPIGYHAAQRDASVVGFYATTASYCTKHNHPISCYLEGKITVRGQIVRTIGAHLQPDAVVYAINLYSVVHAWLQAKR